MWTFSGSEVVCLVLFKANTSVDQKEIDKIYSLFSIYQKIN